MTREEIVALANSYHGCGVGTDKTRYVTLLQSPDPADHTAQMVAYFADPKTSGCALTIRGLWRLAGISDPLLGAYRIGHAIADLLAIARQRGAWVDGQTLGALRYTPQPGDVGYVAAPEHVFTIVEVGKPDAKGSRELTTIDGGQLYPDAKGVRQQMIMRRTRTWKTGGFLLADLPHGGGLAKQVLGLVDVSKLFPVKVDCK